jgi:nicotinamide-nucleotide amidase
VLDPELSQRISDIVARLSVNRGWQLDAEASAAGVRKQAMVPIGATVLEPIGTAPGLVVPVADDRSGPPIVVLPGPPSELQPMWPVALADAQVQAAIAGRAELRQQTLRLWGVAESDLAAVLRSLDSNLAGLEITTCLRIGELEIVTRFAPEAQPAYDGLVAAIRENYGHELFSTDGATVDELVATGLIERGLTIATAESCTAGLLSARLVALAGASAYLLGGLVVYGNVAKQELAEVPATVLAEVGAVSAEVAQALAEGARAKLHADIGIGITGIAGPGGGTTEKPVGLVHVCITGPGKTVSRRLLLPGSRTAVRTRTTEIAMHLIRELLNELD